MSVDITELLYKCTNPAASRSSSSPGLDPAG